MKLIRFPRLWNREQKPAPATVQVHTDVVEPVWRRTEAWPPEKQHPREYYAPKKRKPATARPDEDMRRVTAPADGRTWQTRRDTLSAAGTNSDPEMGFVVSLSREKQLRLARIVRHGYRIGAAPARASNVVPLRMAA